MKRSLALLRRIGPRLALLPGALLLLALVAGSVHHHARESGSHPCAICTLSHAPATTVAAVVPPTCAVHAERVILEPATAPFAAGVASPSCRAPPAA